MTTQEPVPSDSVRGVSRRLVAAVGACLIAIVAVVVLLSLL